MLRFPSPVPIRPLARLLCGLATCLLVACNPLRGGGSDPSPSAGGRPYVVLVSFDGMRWDYLDRNRPPNFARVAAAGVRAEGLVPVFPSKTFPNHYSLVTGMYAGEHGIVGNEFWDAAFGAEYRLGDRYAVADGRFYGGEPIWATAERQGVRSGVFFWPGSEAEIGGIRPSRWKPYHHELPNDTRVDTILSWLRLPAAERPHLLAMYMSDVDDAGHRHGPDAPETSAAVAKVDRSLGRLLDGIAASALRDSVYVVLVSDHGMAATRTEQTEYLADHADLNGVRLVGSGPTSSLFFAGDTARMERTRAALAAGLRHARVYRRDQLPERWHLEANPRLGDLLVVADLPWLVQARRPAAGAAPRAARGGTHGWDNRETQMHGILLASGPAIRPGTRLGRVEAVRVYALLADLLRIRPSPRAESGSGALRGLVRR